MSIRDWTNLDDQEVANFQWRLGMNIDKGVTHPEAWNENWRHDTVFDDKRHWSSTWIIETGKDYTLRVGEKQDRRNIGLLVFYKDEIHEGLIVDLPRQVRSVDAIFKPRAYKGAFSAGTWAYRFCQFLTFKSFHEEEIRASRVITVNQEGRKWSL